MGLYERAEQEAKRANADDYGKLCINSALKAFKSLCEDGHSGLSINITKKILNRLIDGLPLSAITEDDFKNVSHEKYKKGITSYQCPRMSSLFKDVDENGNVTYHDNNRVIFVDTYWNDEGSTWHNRFASKTINEMFPIKLPYYPTTTPYKVYGKTMYLDENGKDVTHDNVGSYTVIILDYVITPDGKRIDINKKFDAQNY